MLLLTSFDRASRYACKEDTPENRKFFTRFIYSVSRQIQAYLNNDFESKQRIEFFDLEQSQREIWVGATPVTILTKVEHSFDSQFDGTETTLTDTVIGADSRSILLNLNESSGKRVLRITYTGGVATTGTLSTFTIGSVIGSFVVGKFATGFDTGAVGIIKSISATSISIDNLYGVYSSSEKITMQNSEGGDDVPGIEATISAITIQSLAEQLPELADACDIQVSYNIRIKDNIENITVEKDETTRRGLRTTMSSHGKFADLQPEVVGLIQEHRRIRL